MDIEQSSAMQFLGFLGVFAESKKIVMWNKRIFSQITLSLILPLSVLVLIHAEISDRFLGTLVSDEDGLKRSRAHTAGREKLLRAVAFEWARFLLFKAVYFTLLLAFSLLSTAAVVYTVASIYAAKTDISFSRVVTVVPKVCKRLIVTFSHIFFYLFVYPLLIFAILVFFVDEHFSFTGVSFFCLYLAAYGIVIVFFSFKWQIAGVVSVLEDLRGCGALRKSEALMKGKMWTSFFVFGVLVSFGFLSQFAYQKLVVDGNGFSVTRAVYGTLCLMASMSLLLLGLVVQTALYFICKSYHHESIDKSALTDRLEIYLQSDGVSLTAKDVQLQEYRV